MLDDARPTRPLAPDFAPHDVGGLARVEITDTTLTAIWSDGVQGRYHVLWLRENEVTPGVIDHVTREREVEIDQFDPDLRLLGAEISDGPAVTRRARPLNPLCRVSA